MSTPPNPTPKQFSCKDAKLLFSFLVTSSVPGTSNMAARIASGGVILTVFRLIFLVLHWYILPNIYIMGPIALKESGVSLGYSCVGGLQWWSHIISCSPPSLLLLEGPSLLLTQYPLFLFDTFYMSLFFDPTNRFALIKVLYIWLITVYNNNPLNVYMIRIIKNTISRYYGLSGNWKKYWSLYIWVYKERSNVDRSTVPYRHIGSNTALGQPIQGWPPYSWMFHQVKCVGRSNSTWLMFQHIRLKP